MNDIHSPNSQPLIPRTPASTAVAGGAAATVLAALGWVTTEFIAMEQRLERIDARNMAVIERFTRELDDMNGEIKELNERVILLRGEVDQRGHNTPERDF